MRVDRTIERTHGQNQHLAATCDRQLHSPSFAPSGARGAAVWLGDGTRGWHLGRAAAQPE